MIKYGGLSFYHQIMVVKNAWKNPANVREPCNFLINFTEKSYFQFFVVLTTKNTQNFFFCLKFVLLCHNLSFPLSF